MKIRKEKDLILILKNLADKESISINYIMNNLIKINNLYNLKLNEKEIKLIRDFNKLKKINSPFELKP